MEEPRVRRVRRWSTQDTHIVALAVGVLLVAFLGGPFISKVWADAIRRHAVDVRCNLGAAAPAPQPVSRPATHDLKCRTFKTVLPSVPEVKHWYQPLVEADVYVARFSDDPGFVGVAVVRLVSQPGEAPSDVDKHDRVMTGLQALAQVYVGDVAASGRPFTDIDLGPLTGQERSETDGARIRSVRMVRRANRGYLFVGDVPSTRNGLFLAAESSFRSRP